MTETEKPIRRFSETAFGTFCNLQTTNFAPNNSDSQQTNRFRRITTATVKPTSDRKSRSGGFPKRLLVRSAIFKQQISRRTIRTLNRQTGSGGLRRRR